MSRLVQMFGVNFGEKFRKRQSLHAIRLKLQKKKRIIN